MIDTKVLKFQNDLQTGMTIESALQKHNLSFLEVWEGLHYKPRTRKKRKKNNKSGRLNHSTGERYISLNQNGYLLRKGKKYFGRYNTLADAVFVRDYLVEFGWTHRNMVTARNKL